MLNETKPTLIFITETPPAPITSGSTQRTAALLETLSERYKLVGVILGSADELPEVRSTYPDISWRMIPKRLPLNNKPTRFFNKLNRKAINGINHFVLGNRLLTKPYPKLEIEIQRLLKVHKSVGIFTRYVWPYCLLGQQPVPLIVDVDDDYREELTIRREALRGIRRVLARWRDKLICRRIDRLLKDAHGVLLAKQEDVVRYQPITKAYCAPNSFRQEAVIARARRLDPQELKVGFIGSSWPPNREGVNWLINVVLPKIRQSTHACGKMRFIFAGTICEYLEKTNVSGDELICMELRGTVADKRKQFYDQIDISVSPAFSGAGSPVKFFEALGIGIPVLATSGGARGYGNKSLNSGIRITDEASEWASHLQRLSVDSEAYARMLLSVGALRTESEQLRQDFRESVLRCCDLTL